MAKPDVSTMIYLLAFCAAVLVLILLAIFRISRRLTRIERSISSPQSRPEVMDAAPSAGEAATGGAFEMFLSEDPARREMPKAEQFSAYRSWRQEKGLNWSNS